MTGTYVDGNGKACVGSDAADTAEVIEVLWRALMSAESRLAGGNAVDRTVAQACNKALLRSHGEIDDYLNVAQPVMDKSK